MALTKHAGFQVLSARIATEGGSLMRTAHRHEFEYEPRPGYLYVRSRAISSRCNDNFDEFPAEEIKTAYRTFVGKPVFVNHHNDNHRRARGVIKDAVLHEDVNPDGSPDTWVEVLMEVDAVRFPKLAQAILAGEIDRTSMGTDVAFSKCSFCGNKAASPVEYCSHIPKLKGQRIYRRTANGSQEGILVREICYGLGFFENSLLVEEPADPTAFFLGVDDHSSLTRAASKTAASQKKVPASEVKVGDQVLEAGQRMTVVNASHVKQEGQVARVWLEMRNRDGESGTWDYEPAKKVSVFSSRKTADNKVGCRLCGAYKTPQRDAAGDWYCRECKEPLECDECGQTLSAQHKHATASRKTAEVEPDYVAIAKRQFPGVQGEIRRHPRRTNEVWFVYGKNTAGDRAAGYRFVQTRNSFSGSASSLVDWADLDTMPLIAKVGSRKTAEVEPVEVAGLAIVAEDTGRILMIQRSFADEDDPARGTWEFPGGHLDDGEHPPTAAIREFSEEVGCEPPHGDIVGSWRSGPIYQGFVMTVPTEGDVDIHCREGDRAVNPDDPNGDDLESVAWWTLADAKANPALRPEVKSGTDWSVFEKVTKTAMPGPFPTEHEPFAIPDTDGTYRPGCSCGWRGETTGDDRILAHLQAVLHANQVAWDRGLQTGMDPYPDTYYHPKKQGAQAFAPAGSKTASALNYDLTLACGDKTRYIGSQPGQVEVGKAWTCKEHGGTTVSEVSGPGTTDKGLGWDKQGSLAKTALGEVQAPKQVDTLREEACPVCGEGDTYDGDKCQVCGFVAPPGEFMDPDLDKAKQTDLRQDKNEDKGGGLTCSNCGATFPAAPAASATPDKPKQAVIMDPAKGSDEQEAANPVETGLKAGDPCPDCGEGTLEPALTEGAPDPNAPADPAQPGVGDATDPAAGEFLPAGSASSDHADDADPSDESDDEDGEDGKKPPFMKKKKPTAARSRVSDVEGADVDMRPALAALAAQQKQIEALLADNVNLRQTVAFIAEVAGINEHPRVTAGLKATAVDDNPAFGGGWTDMKPVESAPEAPVESTTEAATPQAKADVEAVGEGPLTDVSPDAQTSVTDSGTVLPVQAPAQQEVTAPVAGTDTLGKGEVGAPGTNRIETEVEVGTPSDNSAAFRDGGFLGSVGEGRVIAGLRLARLRIEAGLENGDDIELGQAIASSQVSDETIQGEIDVLSKVVTANKTATARPVARNLVPRAASGVQRTIPSMQDGGAPGIEVSAAVTSDELAFE